ncbi:MAG: hypothetical protein D6785_12685, partial [Planctomycetota bacterium]
MKIHCYHCKNPLDKVVSPCPHCRENLAHEFVEESKKVLELWKGLHQFANRGILSPTLEQEFCQSMKDYLKKLAAKSEKKEKTEEVSPVSLPKSQDLKEEEVPETPAQEVSKEGILVDLSTSPPSQSSQKELIIPFGATSAEPLSSSPPEDKEEEKEKEEEKIVVEFPSTAVVDLKDVLVKKKEDEPDTVIIPTEEKRKGLPFSFQPSQLAKMGKEEREALQILLHEIPKVEEKQQKRLLKEAIEKITKKIGYSHYLEEKEYLPFLQALHLELSSTLKKKSFPSLPQKEVPSFQRKAHYKPKEPNPEWEALKSLMMENVLWLVSAFLIFSGVIFFALTSWKNLSGALRFTLSSFSLFGLSLFMGIAGNYLILKKINAPGKLFSWLGYLLFPFSFVILSFFHGQRTLVILSFSIQILGFLGILYWVQETFTTKKAKKQKDQKGNFSHLLVLTWILAFFGILHLILNQITPFQFLFLCYAVSLAFLLIFPFLRLARPFTSSLLWLVNTVIWVGNGLVHMRATFPKSEFHYIAPLFVLFGIQLNEAYGFYQQEKAKEKGEISFGGVHLLGYLLAFCGVFLAFPHRMDILIASAFATVLFGRDGHRFQLPLLTLVAYIFGLVFYLLSPTLLPDYSLKIKILTFYANLFGYAPDNLPFAYFGILLLPYIAFLCYSSILYWKSEKKPFHLISLGFALFLGCGYLILAHMQKDLRPAMLFIPPLALVLYITGY